MNPGGGNVGIGTGTSAPTTTLQVAGTINATAVQQGGVAVSLSTHNHSGVYSEAAHTHTGVYVASGDYTAADVLAKLLTVDGTGSGLDADLLDGQSAAYYATAAEIADSGWVELTAYESGWSATNNAGETPARVRKVGNLVMCKGGVESNAVHSAGTGKSVLTLPEGYRPNDRRIFASYNTLAAPISLRLDSDGTLYITNNSASTISANTVYALDGIAFFI